jgi:hypothetical protein
MKVRSDFVTNSSSVSFIITMHLEMTEIQQKMYGKHFPENLGRVLTLLREKMLNEGTRVMLEDQEIYTYKLEFSTDETMTPDAYGRPHEEIDLTVMNDEEVWIYIYGAYILEGRITSLMGFGATQVETH